MAEESTVNIGLIAQLLQKLNPSDIEQMLKAIDQRPSTAATTGEASREPVDPALRPPTTEESGRFDFTVDGLLSILTELRSHRLVVGSQGGDDLCECKSRPDPESVFISFDDEKSNMIRRIFSVSKVATDLNTLESRLASKDTSVGDDIKNRYRRFMTNYSYFSEKLDVFCRVIRSIECNIKLLKEMDRSSESFRTKIITLKRLLQLLMRSADELKKQLDFVVKTESLKTKWNSTVQSDDEKIGDLVNVITPYYKHLFVLLSKLDTSSETWKFVSGNVDDYFGPTSSPSDRPDQQRTGGRGNDYHFSQRTGGRGSGSYHSSQLTGGRGSGSYHDHRQAGGRMPSSYHRRH